MTNLTMPNNFCFIKYTLKSVLGLADVGEPHGVEYGAPELHPDVWRGRKKFQITHITMPNRFSLMNCVLQ